MTLQDETTCFLETLGTRYPVIQHNIPEELILHLYRYKNLTTHISQLFKNSNFETPVCLLKGTFKETSYASEVVWD